MATPKRKNAHAAALARHKWQHVPPAERKAQMAQRSREAHASMTPEARSARARKAAIAMHKAHGHKLSQASKVDCEPTAQETAE